MSTNPPEGSSNHSSFSDDDDLIHASLEEKIERWQGWDDTKWKPDWAKVYTRTINWSAFGGVVGALHALATSRNILLNSVAFAGYSTIVAGSYYVSREAFFGREIARFREESLALGLPESTARDYPWRWDFLCGTIPGSIIGLMSGKGRAGALVGATLFGVGAITIRAGAKSFTDYMLPIILPMEAAQLERTRERIMLTDEEIDRKNQKLVEEEKNKKSWIASNIPEWSPIQVWTAEERAQKEKDRKYVEWLEQEVERLRVSIGVKRRVKELIEQKEAEEMRMNQSSSENQRNTDNQAQKL